MLQFEDKIFTEWRLRLYGVTIAVVYTVVLIWKIFFDSVLVIAGKPACIDFCWIYASGSFVFSNDPTLVYDDSAFSAAQATLVGPTPGGIPFFHYVYPPTFLFFTLPLALMPYFAAFAVWIVSTLLLYLAAVYAIIPRLTAVIAAITPIAVVQNIRLGQNGFLTAAFIGFSLALLERQPWLSGIFIGLLTYKPQFGTIFPLVLLASRNWRAFASAAATSVILGVGAAIAFGYQGWLFFIRAILNVNSSLSPDPRFELINLQSVYGLMHWAGAGVGISWTLHLAFAAVVTLTICAVWARPVPYSLKAAALCIGSLAVTPYVQIYDLCILPIGVAFLVRDGLALGFMPGERTAILTCLAGLSLVVLRPVAAIIYVILLFLILRRVVVCRGRLATSSPNAN